ncbi:MAG: hypothetical protein KGJ57_00045 [Sphingomonadales bacterium]|nr:hypothetical protein [Sphingomonadales bacterium]MDE2167798.1 hypothetical protein [Sphingomonadales bacterium]
MELAPARRDKLLQAQAACSSLLVATLVHSTERRLRGVKSSERAAVIEEMVNFLLGFGLRAETDIATAGLSMEKDKAAF